jgi:hypothetical protein
LLFGENSRLQGVGWKAFSLVAIPTQNTRMELGVFANCGQLCSLLLDPGSRLERIGRVAFFARGCDLSHFRTR